MDYWTEILQRYLSYKAVRYVLAAIGAILFIASMLIIDRFRRKIRIRKMAARIRSEKKAAH